MEHAFGSTAPFTIGLEEELLLVEGPERRLAHESAAVLAEIVVLSGSAHHDFYAAIVELASTICADAGEGAAGLAALRAAVRAAGGTAIGCGLHPTAQFGDVEVSPGERYVAVADFLAGTTFRTPETAFHVHVGMPDPETAIRVANGLREYLPLLHALAANSPYWHGIDSGLASARRVVNRAKPRFDPPPLFRDFADYERRVSALLAAGEIGDYTMLWWDVRPHPRLGTVEVRVMDTQSSLASAAGLAALIHGLAVAEVERRREEHTSHEVLAESLFRAGRYGLDASVWYAGGLRPVREWTLETLAEVRPYARAVGSEPALGGVEEILERGNGADRQRKAHAAGGMPAVLEHLVEETAAGLFVPATRRPARTR